MSRKDTRQDAKRSPRNARKRRIRILVLFLVLILLAGAGAVGLHFYRLSSEYDSALELAENGSYDSAIAVFKSLPGYRDSDIQVLKCTYGKAVQFMTEGEYESAVQVFETIIGYADSAARIDECRSLLQKQDLAYALELYDGGEYGTALEALTPFAGNPEADAAITECRYQLFLNELQDADVVTAIQQLESWSGYGDSSARIEELKSTSAYLASQLRSLQPGDTFFFGSYEQDNDTGNGAEPLEWLVLSADGGKLLVISKYCLESRPYNTAFEFISWETCELREWLNSEFYSAAFSEKEAELIENAYLENPENEYKHVSSGNDTYDHVFVLSYEEAASLFQDNRSRKAQPTELCKAQRCKTGEYDNSCTIWWLRTSGWDKRYAVYVHSDGHLVNYDSWQVYAPDCTVRPAIYLDLNIG